MALGQRAKGHLAIVLLGFWHVNVFGYALVLHVCVRICVSVCVCVSEMRLSEPHSCHLNTHARTHAHKHLAAVVVVVGQVPGTAFVVLFDRENPSL
jgi:hypothetical protein